MSTHRPAEYLSSQEVLTEAPRHEEHRGKKKGKPGFFFVAFVPLCLRERSYRISTGGTITKITTEVTEEELIIPYYSVYSVVKILEVL